VFYMLKISIVSIFEVIKEGILKYSKIENPPYKAQVMYGF